MRAVRRRQASVPGKFKVVLQKNFKAPRLSRTKSIAALGRFNPDTGAAAAAGEVPVRHLLVGQSQVHAEALAQSGNQHHALQCGNE